MQGLHIAGVFEDDSDAQAVINALAVAGISRADIGLYPSSDAPMNSDITTTSATEHSRAPLVRLFRSQLGMDQEDGEYSRLFSHSLQRGCSVVTVHLTDETQLDAAVDVMNRFKPVALESPAAAKTQRGAVHVFRPASGKDGAV